MAKKKKLTDKQKRFVEEYLIDLNATQAAIRAGYKENRAYQTAHENLKKPEIAEEIQSAMNRRSERTEITQDFVLNGIVKNIQRCEQIEPVLDRKGNHVYVETPDGEMVPAYTYDAKNALKGYELLGKHKKMFTDKLDHSSSDGTMTPQQIVILPAKDKDE